MSILNVVKFYLTNLSPGSQYDSGVVNAIANICYHNQIKEKERSHFIRNLISAALNIAARDKRSFIQIGDIRQDKGSGRPVGSKNKNTKIKEKKINLKKKYKIPLSTSQELVCNVVDKKKRRR